MAKGPFGLRRLSDALDLITPKKLKKKYFRKEDEEHMTLSVLTAKVRTADLREDEIYFGTDGSYPTVPLREEGSPSKKESIKV